MSALALGGVIEPDLAKTKENGQLYMPVVFPGFSWANLKPDTQPNWIPRNGGRFLWTQAWNARQAGARMLKIAMFDEVNEGTAMFKLAAKRSDAPKQGFWLTLVAGRERPCTVRLVFAEPEPLREGERVFDVKLQGKPVLSNFDVCREAGGIHRGVVRELRGIRVSETMEIELVQASSRPPLLCGVELIMENR